MNERIRRLRKQSFEAEPSISIERAVIETEFYKQNDGKYSIPKAMDISCDAVLVFAERHAALAEEWAKTETDPKRLEELKRIAEVCRWVPANAPRNLWEAIQMYWFCHLGGLELIIGG